MESIHPVISAFQKAAADVPAYQQILQNASLDSGGIQSLEDFCGKVPVLDKQSTFGSFPVAQLQFFGCEVVGMAAKLSQAGFEAVPSSSALLEEKHEQGLVE